MSIISSLSALFASKSDRPAPVTPPAAPLDRSMIFDLINPAPRSGPSAGVTDEAPLWSSLSPYIGGNPAGQQRFTQATECYDEDRGGLTVWSRDAAFYDRLQETADKNLHVAALIEQRGAEVLCLPRRIVVDSTDPLAQDIREFVENEVFNSPDQLPLNQRLAQILNAVFWGFSVHEIMWGVRPGDRIGIDALAYRWPGQFVFDASWNLYMSSGYGAKLEKMPREKFIVARGGFPILWDNPYGNGILHRLRYVDAIKRNVERYWVLFAEQFGAPTVIAKMPLGANDRKNLYDEVRAALNGLGKRLGILLPKDVEFDELSRMAPANGRTVHQAILKYISDLEAQLILGSTLTTAEAEKGTRAQAEVHQTTSEKRTEADASSLCDIINRQLIATLVRLNFGELPREMVPYFVIDTDPGENLTEKAALYTTLVRDLNLAISESHLREVFNAPAPDDVDDDNEPPPPTTPPASKTVAAPAMRDCGCAPIAAFADREASFVTPAAVARIRSWGTASDRLYAEMLADVRAWFMRWRDAVIPYLEGDDIVTIRAVNLATPENLPRELLVKRWMQAEALSAIRAMSDTLDDFSDQGADSVLASDSDVVASFADPVSDDLLAYRQGVEILQSRDIVTESQLASYQTMLVAQGVREEIVASVARARALVFAGDVSSAVTALVRDSLVTAARDGISFADWRKTFDDVPVTDLPGSGSQARMETIYRTEVNRVYHEQREALYAKPAVASRLLGFDWYNPNDDRSRETHAALIGFIPIDSPSASEVPPLSYNCRCAKFPVMKRPGRVAPEVDREDLAARWNTTERFRVSD
jgi:SPP1 gp7 family putative phage head morphogenesis protein